jgi:hypothetical protein
MRTVVHPSAANPLGFGRRQPAAVAAAQEGTSLNEDVRLFLWTFAAGFLSISIYLA